jgi:diguanylate cyclase (GGDEF)-like protein
MDRHTLFSMQAMMLIFLGIVVLLAFRTQRRQRSDFGGYWFGAGYLCGGIGLMLQAERGVISPIYSILLGNALFMLLSVFMNRAISETTGQDKGPFYYLLALDAATVANYAYFTFVQPNVLLRTVEAGLVMLVMRTCTIVLLLRSRDRVILPAARAIMVLLAGHAIATLYRIGIAWKSHQADAGFSWSGLIAIAGSALCFLWMDNLRQGAELERRAMTDPLTGLLNRRGLELLAGHELDLASRHGWDCSALMLDVNRFKSINDTLGHAAGDRALSAVAEVLKNTLRPSDLVSRIGGDEFFILLPNAGEETVDLIVPRLRLAVSALTLRAPSGETFTVSVSIGAITRQAAYTQLPELLHQSDLALYGEKRMASPQAEGLSQENGGGAHVQPSSI